MAKFTMCLSATGKLLSERPVQVGELFLLSIT